MSKPEHEEAHQGEHPPKHKHKKHHRGAHAEHEHEEGWIVSFADNVLLMMGFFVILLAMNMGPKGTSDAAPTQADTPDERLLDVAIAIREAFNNPVSLESTIEADQPLVRRLRQKMTGSAGGETERHDDGEEPQSVRPTDWTGDGGYVEFNEKQSLLTATARATIADITSRTKGTRWIIEIRGHASRFETHGDIKTGRHLAYERAWSVGQEMVRNGLTWDQIRLVSSGDSAPVIARARTRDEAQTNQRTEILVLREVAPADPYNSNR